MLTYSHGESLGCRNVWVVFLMVVQPGHWFHPKIRVCMIWLVFLAQEYHTTCQVCNKTSISRFESIRGMYNLCFLICWVIPFGTQYCPNLLFTWCGDICMLYVSCLHIQVIQGSTHQTKTNSITRDNAGISDGRRGFSLMTGHQQQNEPFCKSLPSSHQISYDRWSSGIQFLLEHHHPVLQIQPWHLYSPWWWHRPILCCHSSDQVPNHVW